jgi:hypothetical protein
LPRSKGLNFRKAVSLVERVCDVAGSRELINDAHTHLAEAGVVRAVAEHDDRVIFNWLIEAISYQGIADSVAASYMETHGTACGHTIALELESEPGCEKLRSYWQFTGCGYRKTKASCNRQRLFKGCPLPRLDLRNGSLNQAAYSLSLFMRDVCNGDFVAWIDHQMENAGANGRHRGNCLIEPLRHVHGLSWKVLSMSLATLLLGADPKRPLWQSVGGNLIAIDTLVHNWLHRSGILRGQNAEHPYGPACYAEFSCSDIILRIACEIDGRAFSIKYPRVFPRFVQKAIWSFCAASELDQCNGNRINDNDRCRLNHCAIFDSCGRLKLGRHIPAA